MVEGIYYGRSDRTRTRLSDTEVVRHHARREALDALTERLLDEEARATLSRTGPFTNAVASTPWRSR